MATLGILTRNQGHLFQTKCTSVLYAFSLGMFGPSSKVHLHSQFIDKNLHLITKDKVHRIDSKIGRPLILLYSWTLAKDKNVMKYVKIYADLGFDVLKIGTPVFQLLFPTKGTQVMASRILQFLHDNPSFDPLVVHGFSVGCYAFGELLEKVEKEGHAHNNIIAKFRGQIWDSPVDLYGLSSAVSKAVTHKKVLQKILEKILEMHLKVNYKVASVHYDKSSSLIHANDHKLPSLFLYSKADVVSPPEMSINVFTKWKDMKVNYKCYETSKHCGHFVAYPEEYVRDITSFLSSIRMMPSLDNETSANE